MKWSHSPTKFLLVPMLALACQPASRSLGHGGEGGSAPSLQGDGGDAGDGQAQTGGSGGLGGSAESAQGGSNGGDLQTGGSVAMGGGRSEAAAGAAVAGAADPGGSSGLGNSAGVGGADEGGTPTCSDPETFCAAANACRNLETDSTHCGSCSHDCGPLSACTASRCQPASLLSGLTNLQGMDVSPNGVFFSAENIVQYCAKPSNCAATRQQIGSPGSAAELAVTKTLGVDAVAFFGRNAISDKYPGYYTCPRTGCGIQSLGSSGPSGSLGGLIGFAGDFYFQSSLATDPSTSFVTRRPGKADGSVEPFVSTGDRAKPKTRIAVDENYAYYVRIDVDSAANVVACDRLTGCATYTSLNTGDPTNFAAYGGVLYWLNGIQLKRVAATDPSTAKPVVTLPAGYDGDMLVDAQSIYWLTPSSILYCALPSCVGGVKTLVSGLTAPAGLRQDGSFLYWFVRSEAAAATGGIYRIAKP